jgi:hypothetical protein
MTEIAIVVTQPEAGDKETPGEGNTSSNSSRGPEAQSN